MGVSLRRLCTASEVAHFAYGKAGFVLGASRIAACLFILHELGEPIVLPKGWQALRRHGDRPGHLAARTLIGMVTSGPTLAGLPA